MLVEKNEGGQFGIGIAHDNDIIFFSASCHLSADCSIFVHLAL
jgi:hypothetical protein